MKKPYTSLLKTRIDPMSLFKFSFLAEQRDRSMSQLLRQYVKDEIQKNAKVYRNSVFEKRLEEYKQKKIEEIEKKKKESYLADKEL